MMSIGLSEKLHITYEIDNLSTNLTLVSICLLRRGVFDHSYFFCKYSFNAATIFCDAFPSP